MYIQSGHGLNDFQEFQIRGLSKGGLISMFIFKGIYQSLRIQVKFKGGFFADTFRNLVINKKNCGFVLVHSQIHIA